MDKNFVFKPLSYTQFQMTILHAIWSLKAEFVENNKKLAELQQEIQELKGIKNNQNKEFAAIRSDIAELNKKIEAQNSQKSELPIREAIIGEWEMVSYENFRDYSLYLNPSFDVFAGNVKFRMEGKKLVEVRGDVYLEEGVVNDKNLQLFVYKNHLKTIWRGNSCADRWIEDGKLHYVNYEKSFVFKRVYKRV